MIAGARFTLAVVRYDSDEAQELLSALYREQVAIYGSAEHPSSSDVADFDEPSGIFLAGRLQNRAIACGGLRLTGGGVGEVKRMYVDPPQRARGYGRVLLAALEDRARLLGASRLILETGRLNVGALALYRSAGYQPVKSYVSGRDPAINRAFVKAFLGGT